MKPVGDDDAGLESLVLQALEDIQANGPEALEALCEANPEHADDLRSAIAPLAAIGLASPPAHDSKITPLGPGTTFAGGEFILVREIGRGGMGVVFEATQTSLDRRVALKLLARPLELDPKAVERFGREARIAASLNHPGIAEVYAFGDDNGVHYIAMERIEGKPLDQVQRETPHPEQDPKRSRSRTTTDSNSVAASLRLCERVARALHYAHGLGIVHRDVKPSNILIRPDGSPILTDFGLAQDLALPGLTCTGAFIGTPHYTAPEQHTRSHEDLDGRADVFALGVTLYELLTKRRPFGGNTTRDVLQNVARTEPLDPKRANPTLPDDIAAIVLKALEKDPRSRYATAQAFADDLHAFLHGRPVSARRASTAAKLQRWVRREPLRAGLLAALLIAIPTTTALGGYVVASRPLIHAAEQQSALDAAEASLVAGCASGMRESPADQRDRDLLAALETALAHPATHTEALVLLVTDQIQANPRRCLELLEAHPHNKTEAAEPRAITRIRALCARALGDAKRANALEADLGEPRTSMEHFLIGKTILNSPADNLETDRSHGALVHFQIAAMLSEAPRPTILRNLAVVAGNIGDSELARATADAVTTKWPGQGFSLETKGLALEAIDPQEAITAFRAALDVSSGTDASRILGNLGQLYSMESQLDQADECLAEALRLDPNNAFAHLVYARMHLLHDFGSLADAVSHADRSIALEHTPAKRVHGYRLKIRALAQLGRGQDAIDTADEALALAKDNFVLVTDLFNALLSAGRFDEVLARYDSRVAATSSTPEQLGKLWSFRADALDGLGRTRETLATLQSRAHATPMDPSAWHEVALCAMRRDPDGQRLDLDVAIHASRRASTLSAEQDPYILLTHGTVCIDCSNFDEAKHAFDATRALLETPRWTRAKARLEPELVERMTRLDRARTR